MKIKIHKTEKILLLNRVIFPYLMSISFFFSFLESYTYIGSLRRFILIDSRHFLSLSFISIVLVLVSRMRNEDYKPTTLENFILNLNALFLIPLLILYWIMTVLNSIKYSNYVFATFHIQPQNFWNIVLLSMFLFVLRFIKLPGLDTTRRLGRIDSRLLVIINRIFRNTHKETIFIVLLPFLLSFYVINNFAETTNRVINGIAFISVHVNYTYDDKMRTVWGFYYDYMKFVEKYTPPNSVILIPPQSNHWLSTGNSELSRYFLYPRRFMHGDVFSIPKSGYDHVLIAKGLWQDSSVDWGWPKVNVEAETIWYINPDTLEVKRVQKDFDSKDPSNMQAWGLIKVRKDDKK